MRGFIIRISNVIVAIASRRISFPGHVVRVREVENTQRILFRTGPQCEKMVDLGGLVVSVLATGPKVRGFDPDRGRWIFKGDKNPLPSEGK
jgi:hypothetical protein